ncbi:hypothetical protein [Streptomyces sp. NBC_01481]|uniref:hypothetical protein n=1 Tax=Streptomyces sp. NBC_01481 TaxID=2975869 RepID=UPI00225547BD|nr:hypothetical protein [Streptomyces sp. NBC_01481]MCX4584068.1 hypothetical protein [Streptomyces sp. NBC_01481]
MALTQLASDSPSSGCKTASFTRGPGTAARRDREGVAPMQQILDAHAAVESPIGATPPM